MIYRVVDDRGHIYTHKDLGVRDQYGNPKNTTFYSKDQAIGYAARLSAQHAWIDVHVEEIIGPNITVIPITGKEMGEINTGYGSRRLSIWHKYRQNFLTNHDLNPDLDDEEPETTVTFHDVESATKAAKRYFNEYKKYGVECKLELYERDSQYLHQGRYIPLDFA